ncbi:hypothetical protein JTE90_006509 [Oedothorax gibbosus]|uniref:LEM domain-containing protein n=1 Tax=Oedothorax gibbosus TaxID=931172 RepID=A0AAV6VNY6_9ARAC|nr:hypothetical protein JTE90_006509 [Oedothorax gibbosus]
MSVITDETLREQLILYGEDVGPLNSSTRLYWEKRLAKLNKSSNSKEKQLSNAKNFKSSIKYSSKKNKIKKPEKKPVKIQQRDKILLDSLRENGLNILRGPLTDAMRNEYQKKLNSLMLEAAPGHKDIENKLISNQRDSTVDSEDGDLKKSLLHYGVSVPNGPLNDATKHQLKKVWYKLMMNEKGILSEIDLRDAFEEDNHDSDSLESDPRIRYWAFIKTLFSFMTKLTLLLTPQYSPSLYD